MTDGGTTSADLEWTARPGERFALGEGLRHTGAGVVCVDITTGRLFELPAGPDAEPRLIAHLDVPLGAVAPRASGGWVVAAGPGVALLDADSGDLEWLARPEQDAPRPMRMNDAVADGAGRFWATSMATDESTPAGSLYRVDPDGTCTQVLDGLVVPNGPAFDLDGTTMYLAESGRGVIRRYPVDPATGELGEPTEFARPEGGAPDGMIVDEADHLWSALHGGSAIIRYAPDGSEQRRIALPASQPTSICLTGATLLVTTARKELAHPGDADGAVLSTPLALAAPSAAVATV